MVLEDLYSMSTFAPSQNLLLRLPRLLNTCYTQDLSWEEFTDTQGSAWRAEKVEFGEAGFAQSVQSYTASY